MTGTCHILRNPEVKQRLVDEVLTVWPVLDQAPSYEQLEKLPFLASVFIRQVRDCSKSGTDRCDQRGPAHNYSDTRWPSTDSAAVWCRKIWR
jgi:hypothetical protein